ncbi:SusD/RagB family nutrient-binding outer membrane lipoprotein [Mucilaginibacter sp. BJC16-A38]|uniref:SusD/RagB family nutrient-binding outer membrane lipoprotein n=1 Tax=Mucilaginibacter phenanthrenivorans TaxID=1234842 RepID=UPI0021572845|nr:SusD/RagB family nutrient-binding outer membrane lipoprotein [Mucilaginibacter phenanthrenivorans]MCR8556701.1 SusD/RagB family nutrient-binding outer membrane lipoprotein [Mucilaginibacter phenanthrenivorans]
MKRDLTKRMIIPMLILLILGSCKKFGDVNTDPTKSSNLDPANQLALVQLRFSGELTINERTTIIMTMPLVQQIGGAYYNRYGFEYIKNKQYMSELWELGYPNDVLNITDAVDRTASDATKSNLNAICRIMKVYIFSRITDLYGDVPYSQAGKAYTTGVVRPAFDTQKDIYDNFFTELTAAVAKLDATKDAVPKDIYYQGNIAAWKKFANSLRLRLAMRLSKIDPEKAKTEVMAAYAAGVFTSNDDICKTQHADIQNSYSDIRGNGVSVAINQYPDDGRPRVCNTLIDEMKGTNDPRLQYIARDYWVNPDKPSERIDVTDGVKAQIGLIGVGPGKYNYDDYLGSINVDVAGHGTVSVPNNGQKAQLADFLITNDAPYLHLTYAEVEFLLAEATQRWGLSLGADAATHYHNGMAAACQQLALFKNGPVITDAQIQQFKTDNPLAPGKELQMIDTQLWAALLLNGPEAYAEWRRTGFPVLVPAVTAESTSTTTPRRFEYPLTETEQNSANIAKAITALGGTDDWNARVWWDKQ